MKMCEGGARENYVVPLYTFLGVAVEQSYLFQCNSFKSKCELAKNALMYLIKHLKKNRIKT